MRLTRNSMKNIKNFLKSMNRYFLAKKLFGDNNNDNFKLLKGEQFLNTSKTILLN